MENVAALYSDKYVHFVKRILSLLASKGYEVRFLRAAGYHVGGPQVRTRVFLLGSRKGWAELQSLVLVFVKIGFPTRLFNGGSSSSNHNLHITIQDQLVVA